MDQILQTLLSWQLMLFGLAIVSVMFIFRNIVEYFTKVNKISKIWNDLALPSLPPILGVLGGWALKTFPYPNDLTTRSGRIVFGLVAGLMSSLLYRIVKAMIIQKAQAVVPGIQIPNIPDPFSSPTDNQK